MKTKEELNALKEEVETVNEKLHELTDEELEQVVGGVLCGKAYLAVTTPVMAGVVALAERDVLQDKDSGVK